MAIQNYNRSKYVLLATTLGQSLWLLLVVYCLIAHKCYSQQIPNNQCFDTSVLSGSMGLKSSVGCIPFTANAFNTLKGALNHRYIFDYRGGPASGYKLATDSSYTYPKAGIYVLMQLGEKDGKPTRVCATITVQDTTPPVVRMQLCANGLATLTILPDPANQYDDYGIQWGDGSGEIINQQTRTLTHRYTDNLPKQVRVQGIHKYGKCGGTTVRLLSLATANAAPTLTKLAIIAPNVAELTIENPTENNWLLYRQEGVNTFSSSGKTIRKPKETVQVLVDSNQITCFKLQPTDSCAANVSSNVLCVSYIKVLSEPNLNRVLIGPYRYPSEVKNSLVSRNGLPWWSGERTELSREDTDPGCTPKTCYQLKIETDKGTVLSNVACVPPPPVLCNLLGSIFVPDVFSPNADGINDILEIKGDLSQNFQLIIFNQWGNAVFATSDPTQGWNGQQDGKPAKEGNYFYRLDVFDKSKRTFSKRGSFLLLK